MAGKHSTRKKAMTSYRSFKNRTNVSYVRIIKLTNETQNERTIHKTNDRITRTKRKRTKDTRQRNERKTHKCIFSIIYSTDK
jgi:hypothetical protein